MDIIKKKYIVDENNKKIAVQLDIGTFNKIEEIIENYSLAQLMKENDSSKALRIEEAKEFYSKLIKKN